MIFLTLVEKFHTKTLDKRIEQDLCRTVKMILQFNNGKKERIEKLVILHMRRTFTIKEFNYKISEKLERLKSKGYESGLETFCIAFKDGNNQYHCFKILGLESYDAKYNTIFYE